MQGFSLPLVGVQVRAAILMILFPPAFSSQPSRTLRRCPALSPAGARPANADVPVPLARDSKQNGALVWRQIGGRLVWWLARMVPMLEEGYECPRSPKHQMPRQRAWLVVWGRARVWPFFHQSEQSARETLQVFFGLCRRVSAHVSVGACMLRVRDFVLFGTGGQARSL